MQHESLNKRPQEEFSGADRVAEDDKTIDEVLGHHMTDDGDGKGIM